MFCFSIQNARGGRERYNLGCEAGCGLTVSWSDHARIMVGSWSDHSRIGRALEMTFHPFQQISLRFGTVIFRGRRSIW